MAFLVKVGFALTVLFAYSFSVYDAVLYEESLTDAEEYYVTYFGESAIRLANNPTFFSVNATKLERKNYIADFIVRHIRMNFGGNWYAIVYDSDAQNSETGSELKSEGTDLLRFTSGEYLVLVFKFSTTPCMNERTHILEKINNARNSTVNLDLYHGFDRTEAYQISDIILKAFIRYTANFENDKCLNSDESKSTTIYTSTNCYYSLSMNILEMVNKKYPNVRFIMGETLYFSNYNTGIQYSVAFWLGPLYFLAYF